MSVVAPRRFVPNPAPAAYPLLGVTVHRMTADDLLACVASAIRDRAQAVLANHNQHAICLHHADERMRRFFSQAEIVHVDGMPLIYMARLLGHPFDRRHRTTYVDWTTPLMTAAAANRWRVFYLGSNDDVLRRGATVLRQRYPGLIFQGRSGYFDPAADGPDNQGVLAEINAFRPDILMVGMGMPRQEHWIHENRDRVSASVLLPCGAMIDYVAGAIPTPPRWTGFLGIEWLWRLCAEPRRLWRRYLLEPWLLLPYVGRDLRRAAWRTLRRPASPHPHGTTS